MVRLARIQSRACGKDVLRVRNHMEPVIPEFVHAMQDLLLGEERWLGLRGPPHLKHWVAGGLGGLGGIFRRSRW